LHIHRSSFINPTLQLDDPCRLQLNWASAVLAMIVSK